MDRLREDVLAAFGARNDIALAYPTRRLYDNAREGKPVLHVPEDT